MSTQVEIETAGEITAALDSILGQGVPVRDVVALAKLAEAMNWARSAAILSQSLDTKMSTLTTHTVPSEAFEQLSFLADLALAAIAASSDHGSARLILMASMRLHTIYESNLLGETLNKEETSSTVCHLQCRVNHHAMWRNVAFWNGMFFDALTCRLEKSHRAFLEQGSGEKELSAESIAELEAETKEIAFAELIQMVHFMSRFGMTEKAIRSFLDEMRALSMIEPERQAILMDNIDCTSPEASGTVAERDAIPAGFGVGADPVQRCLDMMRGGEEPCSAMELSVFLTGLKHPFHVNTLCSLLGKELAAGQLECTMYDTSFYVMSAVFAVCLAYCHECLDYVSAEHILKLSQALQLRSRGQDTVTMSRRTRCHPFWNQRQFWTNRFQGLVVLGRKELLQSSVFETLSAKDREHEEGAMPFNVLNKSVQLMLSFGVQSDFIVEFIQQTIKMKLFKDEYTAMVQDMIRFVGSYKPQI